MRKKGLQQKTTLWTWTAFISDLLGNKWGHPIFTISTDSRITRTLTDFPIGFSTRCNKIWLNRSGTRQMLPSFEAAKIILEWMYVQAFLSETLRFRRFERATADGRNLANQLIPDMVNIPMIYRGCVYLTWLPGFIPWTAWWHSTCVYRVLIGYVCVKRFRTKGIAKDWGSFV